MGVKDEIDFNLTELSKEEVKTLAFLRKYHTDFRVIPT